MCTCADTRRSGDASWLPIGPVYRYYFNQLMFVRMRRYKEERRRQLAAHVATRLTSNASSSEEEEEADRRSYTEFRYRRYWYRTHIFLGYF